mmetsp:Transcript_3750/g.11670  ORF Transcript_3750/g.11670 Transcript_3750/m.11670 type:complete len:318 (+) Transcript_3750:100-1053(+)
MALAREKLRRAVARGVAEQSEQGGLELGALLCTPANATPDSADLLEKLVAVVGQLGLPPLPTEGEHIEMVYINLCTRGDRRAHMESQLQSHSSLHGRRMEAQKGAAAPDWAAVDEWDAAIGRAVAAEWSTRLNARFDHLSQWDARVPLQPSERGAAMCHALLWARAASRPIDAPPLLICEDDVELREDFAAGLAACIAAVESALPPEDRRLLLYAGADVAAGGWRGRASACIRDGETPLCLREAAYLWHTSSYVVWPAAARALAHALPIDAPVDVFAARLVHERRLRAVVAIPPLAVQGSEVRTGDCGLGDCVPSGR